MRFILVDEIIALEPGESIEAVKYIQTDEPYFRDHFPGFPVVPGVLLTEMMAQAAGKCLDAEKSDRGKAMLAKIVSANFRTWVRPGQKCVLFANILKNRAQYATASTSVQVEDRNVCSAELFFSFLPMDNFVKGFRDEVLESFLNKISQGEE